MITADVVARVARLLAAIAGGCLAWLLYDWLGDPWDHCDYPETCVGSWFGRTFILVQCVWAFGVAAAGLSALAAWRARRPRRDIALIVIGFAGGRIAGNHPHALGRAADDDGAGRRQWYRLG